MNIRRATDNDFDYIYNLSSKNSNLLGFVHPMEIRSSISAGKIIISEQDDKPAGFCIFNPLKKDYTLLTVQIICVDPEYRGQGIASSMVNYLRNTYKRTIKTTCVKDSASEQFWSKIAIKHSEEPGKKRPICRYIIPYERKGLL